MINDPKRGYCELCGEPAVDGGDHGIGECRDVCMACGGSGENKDPEHEGLDCVLCSGLGGVCDDCGANPCGCAADDHPPGIGER